MSNKFRGIIYILNPFVPTIVIGAATLLLFLFWLKVEPEINAFTTSYNRVKTTIDSSADELTIILSDTKKHLVDTVESSGIPDLITAYRAAIIGLEGLCNPQSQDTAQLPPASHDFFYSINGKPGQVRMVTAANRLVPSAGIGSEVYAANYVLRQATVGKPDYHQPPYRHVFLKLDGGTIKQEAKKLEKGLNKALKKAGRGVEEAWEKAKKEVGEKKSAAVLTFSQEIEKIKTEFSAAIAALSKAARQMAKDFGARMDTMAQNSCEFVTGPLVGIIKPVLVQSVQPFMHLDNAIEDLKKLITLQTGIQDILAETEKMYNNLNQTLDLFLSFMSTVAYLLVALLIFILIHRITTRIEEIKKGWQLLTS